MRDFLRQYILTRVFAEKVISVLGMILIIFITMDFAVFFLTAFLCAYLFYEAANWSQ